MSECANDTLPLEGSADVQGCQHWNLSFLQQQQERYARRIRKAVLFEGAATLSKLVAALVEGALLPPVCVYARTRSRGKSCSHIEIPHRDVFCLHIET
jgi:hypothetical protein